MIINEKKDVKKFGPLFILELSSKYICAIRNISILLQCRFEVSTCRILKLKRICEKIFFNCLRIDITLQIWQILNFIFSYHIKDPKIRKMSIQKLCSHVAGKRTAKVDFFAQITRQITALTFFCHPYFTDIYIKIHTFVCIKHA